MNPHITLPYFAIAAKTPDGPQLRIWSVSDLRKIKKAADLDKTPSTTVNLRIDRQFIANWIRRFTPKIEQVLRENRFKSHQPEGDLYSMNFCGEAGKALVESELRLAGIEGNKLFGVTANGHNAIHVGYYSPELHIVIDPTSGQWLDSSGKELSALITKCPELFVGRILVATSGEIKAKLGWDYKVY